MDWIERLTGLDPDAGTGALELLIRQRLPPSSPAWRSPGVSGGRLNGVDGRRRELTGRDRDEGAAS